MNGVLIVAVAGPALLLGVVVAELAAVWQRGVPLGAVIHGWARVHPFLAALLAAFVGAFAAHIFWHL